MSSGIVTKRVDKKGEPAIMRNRSQNVTGEKVRSPKGHKLAPDRQKEAGESPDKKGERIKLSQIVGAGPVPSPWPGAMGRESPALHSVITTRHHSAAGEAGGGKEKAGSRWRRAGRRGSNGSRWRGNAVRRRAVSKTVVDDTAPCTEKREKPNRTKTTPKQTEKRGQRAGERGITENCHRE